MGPVRRAVILLVGIVGLVACGGPSSGLVDPTPGTYSVLRPCSLLSSGDLSRLGATSGRLQPAPAPYCRFVAGRVTIDVTYFDDLGLTTVAHDVSQAPLTIGGHRATRDTVPTDVYIDVARSPAHDTTCTATIGLRETSAVTVGVDVDHRGNADPCPIAMRAAGLVEPHLPYPDRCRRFLATRPGRRGRPDRRSGPHLTGRGAPITFRPDGTGEQDYGTYPSSTSYTATGSSGRLTYMVTGTMTFDWDSENGVLILSGASAGDLTWQLTGNGVDSEGSLSTAPQSMRYLCSAHRLLNLPTRTSAAITFSR
jgi:hypothetical protein